MARRKKRPWVTAEASNIDVASITTNCVARPALSLGLELGWRGRQLRALFRARGESRTVPVRHYRETRDPPRPAARANRHGLAWLLARGAPRTVVRISSVRALCTGTRPSLQSSQT